MKKQGFIILSLSFVLFTTACAKVSASPAPAAPTPIEPTPVTTPVEKPMPEPQIPASHYENVAEGVSPLTGLPHLADSKVAIVQIENTAAARPQSGIAKADLIYEMEVESSVTRLTAFFLQEYPNKVGPVRSIRKQHIQLWSEWDFLYVFFGGSYSVKGQNPDELIEAYGINSPSVNGIRTSQSFFRSPDRKAPHNAYSDVAYAVEKAYDYKPRLRTFFFDEKAEITGTGANKIKLSYASDNRIMYEYDAKSKLYSRFINERPVVDKEDNSQLKVKNIIVQHADHFKVEGTVYTNIDLVGSGNAEYFTEGIQRKGKWMRKDLESLTIFYDEEGNELAMRPGKTYIQIVRKETPVDVE